MAEKVTNSKAESSASKKEFRIEHDYLGKVEVPIDSYWGAQTQRAIINFPISGLKPFKEFTMAIISVKRAAAEANMKAGLLNEKKAKAIIHAADEILEGKLANQFVVDVYQAGAGTSNNMNANEVLANRAIELLGGKIGDYSLIHPNDDVNMGQSTNDVIPTSIRIACAWLTKELIDALELLRNEFDRKSQEFDGIVKSGRTHLMDAAPIRLGQEFKAWALTLKKHMDQLKATIKSLLEVNIGATAVGTGLNANPKYVVEVIKILCRITKLDLKGAENLPQATQSVTDFLMLSSVLRGLSADLVKIMNDIRLMNSGPITGFGEIQLPAVQPGSSIMPGKVNPSMAEMLTMVCFQEIGDDTAISLSSQAGQLELNVMTPLINFCLLRDLIILRNAILAFTDKAAKGIIANKDRMRELLEKTPGVGLVLNPYIGYEKSAEVVKRAIAENKSVKDVVKEMGLLSDKQIESIFDPHNLAPEKN